MNTEERTCQNCKNSFTIEPDDFSFYEKMKVPPPTFCSMCRAQRRFAYRNERKLFRVKDAFTGKEIFSLYPPESGRKMITSDEWYGDSWDGMEFGRDYNFSRPFFEQLFELDRDVPALNLNVAQMVRSEYCANAKELKDCYLIFASQDTENSMYGTGIIESRDCIDNTLIAKAERCYESFWLQNCYQCYYTIMSVDCRNMWFSRDCLGCNDCFGCANLRKSSYCIFNQQFTKEEYKIEIEKININTIKGLKDARDKARKFWKTQITKYHQGLRNVNSTGSYVSDCKNVNDCFLIKGSEDMRYCQNMEVEGNKDCMDVFEWGERCELCYETSGSGTNAYNLKFSWDCWPSVSNCEYSLHLRSCSDCFGCVGLKKKQYCVFNKQYTKEEYEKLVDKIKKHMDDMPYVDKAGRIYTYGEFFPVELSPYGYNNTLASDYFSITAGEAKAQGYPWIEVPRGDYSITKKIQDLPDSIEEVNDSILKEIIECSQCSNPFRIIESELSFLKRENLPLPILCVDCRHNRRISDRLKLPLYERSCMCQGVSSQYEIYKNTGPHSHGRDQCTNTFKTGYKPDQGDIVYCEQCYQQEVV